MSASGLKPPLVRACAAPVPAPWSAWPPSTRSVPGSPRRGPACGSSPGPVEPKCMFIGPCAGLTKLPRRPVHTR
eukprot:1635104-Alexandrium_andersonii.AAC.1